MQGVGGSVEQNTWKRGRLVNIETSMCHGHLPPATCRIGGGGGVGEAKCLGEEGPKFCIHALAHRSL